MIDLPVKYLTQVDSAVPGQWWRMCQSSSISQTVEYLYPGLISKKFGPGQIDDRYLEYMSQYGDTTKQDAHKRALEHLGVTAQFRTDLKESDVMNQLKRGTPVPVGILHKGTVDRPTGGGHYVVIVGCTYTHWIVNDPAGELDLVNGGYHLSNNGDHLRYSKKNFNRRWELLPSGEYAPGNGWGWIFSKGVK